MALNNNQPRPPREHPLWPVFRELADSELSKNDMRDLYWKFFLAGFKAAAKIERALDAVSEMPSHPSPPTLSKTQRRAGRLPREI